MTVLDSVSSSLPLLSPHDSHVPVAITRKRKHNMDTNERITDNALNGSSGKKGTPTKKPKIAPKSSIRGRRKSRWKLKFHHQALPPEYLKHYKQQEKKRRFTETKQKPKKCGTAEGAGSQQQDGGDDDEDGEEEIEGDACRLAEAVDTQPKHESRQPFRNGLWPTPNLLGDSFSNLNIDLSQNKAFIENLLSNQIEINRVEKPAAKPVKPKKPKTIPSSGRIMNYSDLPYMGEITLDGVKPRRGRKPKKADICHLIYKNYGQIFPGAPNSPAEEKPRKQKTVVTVAQPESPLPSVSGLLNHSEVQNRIINSLLERRLTQKARDKPEIFPKSETREEEPLNLCLKDLQSLKIKLSRKHGNIYETKMHEEQLKEIKKEISDVDSEEEEESFPDDLDLTPFNLVTTELKDSDDESVLNATTTTTKPASPAADPMMFWPGGNYFYPPPFMPDLYYQNKLKLDKKPGVKRGGGKRAAQKPAAPNAAQVIAKRKRSAIFIPPVPTESTSNPTTEVSICKFKFTGGAKPSLQEKKMLSVDSGGNFRYYSGTGDKSMRGYEYFPRESLQQCQENTGCSPSGVFLTASALGSGEKIPEDVGHSGFFDPSFPIQLQKTGKPDSYPDSHDGDEDSDSTGPSSIDLPDTECRRLRRSRKSIAREKLEQTFKEKGFLIQTQQLESAEGATYCKFRQLRKFTRYLFRSWKDYLPGNVRDLSESAGVGESPQSPGQTPDT